MEKAIQCPCGTSLRAKDKDELVSKAQQHVKELHGMELTREQAFAMAKPTEAGKAFTEVYWRCLGRGSSASRTPSPRKLHPNTAREIAAPGAIAIQGEISR
jgi:predicted small metal-binding protein